MRELTYTLLDLERSSWKTCDFCSNCYKEDNKSVNQIVARIKRKKKKEKIKKKRKDLDHNNSNNETSLSTLSWISWVDSWIKKGSQWEIYVS